MGILRDVVDLVLPSACVACGVPGEPMCLPCRAGLDLRRRGHAPSPCPPLLPPITVSGWYEGPLRQAILAWKEQRHRSLAGLLGRALATAVPEIPDAVLVAVPPSARSLRNRGEDVLGRLVDRAAAERCLQRARCLRLVRMPLDQAGLDRRARAANLGGAMEAVAVPAGPLVLVDDVVTTGATVAEAVRALRCGGGTVVAVAAIAGRRRGVS